jgi:RNA-directed DNA polymerase
MNTEFVKYLFRSGGNIEDLSLLLNYVFGLRGSYEDDNVNTNLVNRIRDIITIQKLNSNEVNDLLLLKSDIDKSLKNNLLVNNFPVGRLYKYFKDIDSKYTEFEILKKSGEIRTIAAPDKFLKKVLRTLNVALSHVIEVSGHAHGFISERSIRTNAELHTNKNYVLNVDIENFFPSVKYSRIKKELKGDHLKLKGSFAHIIAKFCCFKGGLPQGAPTSPLITNLICLNMDQVLALFAKKHKQVFTRYADDITFSGYRPVYDKQFFGELNRIIKKEDFKLKYSKTRIQSKNKRQEVTGVVVNDKLNLNRKYIRNLRAMIHHYKSGKEMPENTENVIRGKLEFLKMIKGKERVYKSLMNLFNKI